MRAARFDGYGAPEVLYEGRVPRPEAGPDQILVRVHASTVNGGELMLRSGRLSPLTGRRFPKGIGIDFAGEVAAVGAEVSGLAVGDRVWGFVGRTGGSATAEYVAVRPDRVSHSPEGLDSVEAVSLTAGGTTGITALRDKAQVKPGDRVLVRGASGGVGSVVVQLAKAMGTHVTALAGARNLDFVLGLGTDEVFDYATTGPEELARLERFDAIIDIVATDLPAYRRLLTPDGRLVAVSIGSFASLSRLLWATVTRSRRMGFFSGNPTTALFSDLAGYAERGEVRPVVDTVHELAEIADAHRALEAGGVRGKHVIRLI
ncbi:NAD(P)-dependent alcohol dehydrogenase [Nocardiopsis sp. MG754419]|uniref:NAD(P)-dependent alcohol dehydrogenase n=1 Tax=Nocardiopsis sp. MG754419 TaxID=2259865 RepID=UPI001BA9CD85|nr:NAD(P)-dependent alcohol dehydrogenase [Nocardiopsis sp. MG754419]MBR8743548.1 NAD(P)-dependent alcohol dehydrogenase [Nocardiopsis sp. MG754419]